MTTTTERPEDIELPAGWTWDLVEERRAKWGIGPNMVPIANAPGCTAWGTINSVRNERKLQELKPVNFYT